MHRHIGHLAVATKQEYRILQAIRMLVRNIEKKGRGSKVQLRDTAGSL